VVAEHRIPVILRHLEQQVVPQNASVVDQHDRRSQFRRHLVDRSLYLVVLADVGTHRHRAAAGRSDGLNRGAAGSGVQVKHGEGRTIHG
jgi:hypothetical protein